MRPALIAFVLLLAASAAALSACGQSGPLMLPDRSDAEPSDEDEDDDGSR